MKAWLDRVTGIVTMYKLVLMSLAVISAVSIVLSLFGQLGSYTPLSLIESLAVAVAVTWGLGFVASKIARITPHGESAFITGFLVFLVMVPAVNPLGLVGIAIAAAVAVASKYLIAVRGRHIFNPAAIGVFVATLITFVSGNFSLGYAAWWMGTPFLLIPVAILGFAVLYRTQRLAMGLAFIVIGGLIGIGGALLRGVDPTAAFSTYVLSSPLVFFAAFMLSEPLTLPPRRWQQLVEAAVVALLFSVPFTFGLISNTPQFALLVGNLVAFFFGQRKGIDLEYLGKKQLSSTTWELSFQPARPVRFLPGQYMELVIPHRKQDFRGTRRYFSISSAPTMEGPITFAITMPEKSSSFKKALLDLEPGQTVRGTGVGGDFSLPSNTSEPLLLVAGGIGITPFASQLAHAHAEGQKRDVTVVYSVSNEGDLPYGQLLADSGAHVVLFAPTAPSPLPAGWDYAGSGRVTGERLAAAVPDVAKRRAYVSGPPALVNDLRTALRSQGARRVHADYFSGY